MSRLHYNFTKREGRTLFDQRILEDGSFAFDANTGADPAMVAAIREHVQAHKALFDGTACPAGYVVEELQEVPA